MRPFKNIFSLLFLSTVIHVGCTKEQYNPPINNFSDPALVKIYDLQDRRNTKALIPFLKAKEVMHRKQATLAFASIRDTSALPYLLQVAQSDEDPIVRKASAYAMGQLRDSMAAKGLAKSFHHELDLENKATLLEAMGKCADKSTVKFFESVEFKDSQLIIGHMKGIYRCILGRHVTTGLIDVSKKELLANRFEEANFYAMNTLFRTSRREKTLDSSFCNSILNGEYDSDTKYLAEIWLNRENIERSKTAPDANNPYKIAEHWKASSSFSDSELLELMSAFLNPMNQSAISRTTAAEILFDAKNPRISDMDTLRLIEYLHSALYSGDMALQSLACQAISRNEWNTLDLYRDSISKLEALQNTLAIPQQMETYIDFGRLIATLKDEDFVQPNVKFNHPISWEFVKTIPENQKVRVATTKGDIVLECKVNEAPGSVANFLYLVDSGFYDDKYFHRVVPNFVIQGGCPRGDGWGSLNWTQRSEFSNYLHYKKGAVGLASSGNDTEGVQIFITHIPTPHLDGRYTIFAEVVDGMDVVNQISMGDKMLSIRRITNDYSSNPNQQ